jgi:hypothetical protein
VVVAAGSGRDLNAPARPVVAVLCDSSGAPLPRPLFRDLGQCDGPSIVRTLSEQERRDALDRHWPGW